MRTLITFLALSGCAFAQSLQGVVDIHIHGDPDEMARSIDFLALGKLAASRGLRGIVIKNHFEPTAAMAYIVKQQVPSLEVFGAIALNRTVGGVNPAAVEHMAKMKGGLGRVVWMPTFDAENQVRKSKVSRPFVSVSRQGALLPEVMEVLDLIARHKLVLATGHSSAEEVLLLVKEARARGIQGIVVTHPLGEPVAMTTAQMRQAAAQGAFIEFTGVGIIGQGAEFSARQFVETMRAAGIDHSILVSDLGRAGDPLPPDGLEKVMRELVKAGLQPAEIDCMTKVNPARLLGLP